ncbi:hypothetical protein GQ53DRAFT_725593 [Thozetella sp. PMI_491]|nr:hypothetical protein GQ53DRAFT_725593 [Thozetella sp. PMI_491]
MMYSSSNILKLLAVSYALLSTSHARGPLPVRNIAGVQVVDTPIVRDAHDLVQKLSSNFTYKHVMRSWLFSTLIIRHNTTLQQTVDLEAQALGVILHDLGWNQGTAAISSDKRFEVDGAIAARQFIGEHRDAKHWDERRVQLVWDSIALHTEPTISLYKESNVKVVGQGIFADFIGPSTGITTEEYATVVQAFPNDDFAKGVNDTMIWLCQAKPATTYDTWMQPWGEHFVTNYSAVGSRAFDLVNPGLDSAPGH